MMKGAEDSVEVWLSWWGVAMKAGFNVRSLP